MVSILSRLGLDRHVTDADLTAIWADQRLAEPLQTAAAEHLGQCPSCRTRLASLATWLDGLRIEARQEAEAAFPRERLAVQQAQILRRLEAMERPAKVLSFPRFTRATSVPDGGRQRWIAAAAAAGLIVGIGLGQIVDIRRASTPERFAATGPEIARSTSTPEFQRISVRSDEDLLFGEGGTTALVPESLQSLHEITPNAREYDPR